MSIVNDELWRFWMGSMPKPENCTREQMWAMLDTITEIEKKEYAVEQINFYEDMWRQNIGKYKFYSARKNESEEYTKQFVTISETMKLVKQGILFYREWLK